MLGFSACAQHVIPARLNLVFGHFTRLRREQQRGGSPYPRAQHDAEGEAQRLAEYAHVVLLWSVKRDA